MADHLSERFVRALANDLLDRYPEELAAHYRDLPRRMPADVPAREIARILAKLDDDEAAALIRDAIDAALFRIFYLFGDAPDLDGLSIEIIEAVEPGEGDEEKPLLHETYQMMVDPGGLLVRDEP